MSGEQDPYKEAIRDAIHEWLDDTYAAVGRWTVRGIMALLFSIFIHLVLSSHVIDLKQIIQDQAQIVR